MSSFLGNIGKSIKNDLNPKHNGHYVISAAQFFMAALNCVYGVMNLLYFYYEMDNVGITFLIYLCLQDVFMALYIIVLLAVHPRYLVYDVTVYENNLDVFGQKISLLALTVAQNFMLLTNIIMHGFEQNLASHKVLRDCRMTQLVSGVACGLIVWESLRYITAYVRRPPKEVVVVFQKN